MNNKYIITHAFFGTTEHIKYINSIGNPRAPFTPANIIITFLESEQIKKVVIYYMFTFDSNINLSNMINKTITVQQEDSIRLPTAIGDTTNVFDITEIQQATLLLIGQ